MEVTRNQAWLRGLNMNVYDMFINLTPDVYLNEENTMKLIKTWTDLFEMITSYVDNLPEYFYIDTAPLEYLKILGSNVGREYMEGEDVDTYRSLLKIRYYNFFIVPTHNNLLRATRAVAGFYPTLTPTWEVDGTNFETDNTDASYNLSYDLDPTFSTEILDELEKFYPAGVKLISQYLYKLTSKDLKVAGAMYNYDVIQIGFKEEVI